MARRVAFPVLLLLSLLLVGCDHATKALAVHHLAAGKPLALWPGVLDLAVTRNHDSAFSLWQRIGLEPSVAVLVVAMSVALLGLLVMAWRRWGYAGRFEQTGYAIAVAGAAGNLIDRIARGHVVDFVHLHYWPVFNMADVLLVVGLALVLIPSLRDRRDALADR